ncbi:MAG: HAMP domain-containing histidine kinase [Gemmatimonadales bacterium]|nr:HAMP domain-containing histidine kinase [Gemmatimonadales bacterium]
MSAPTEVETGLVEALEAACRQVPAESGGALLADAASSEEVSALVGVISSGVLAHLRGEAMPALPRTHLARRILQSFRKHYLEGAAAQSPPASSATLLAGLGSIEAVAAALEGDWRQRFSDRLSGPDGLELVVEVAHDLRSPLTSILFLAETLRRGRSGPLTPLQERQLGLIYAAAFGLTSVASDVIELARGGERQVDLDPLPFSVADILESVRDIVQPIAEEKGLEVQLVSNEEGLRVGHPVALSRVLLNLTTNALKFTDEGNVEMRAEPLADTRLEFSVRDTGRGIPPNSMAMLFEPFRRRQRDREYAFSGSGLGLSICRKLVEAMGSELKVETEAGKGTTFSFVLALPRVNPEDGQLS